jgi:hypothetical protein
VLAGLNGELSFIPQMYSKIANIQDTFSRLLGQIGYLQTIFDACW